MFKSLLSRRFTSGINSVLMQNAKRFFSLGDYDINSPCLKGYSKRMCKELNKPIEKISLVAFSECVALKENVCTPKLCGSEKLTKGPCLGPIPPPKPILPKKSEFNWPAFCCGDPCSRTSPRFDDLYYLPSNKAEKKYQRTWEECPLVIRMKKICCHNKRKQRPFYRRPIKEAPKSAHEFNIPIMKSICLTGRRKCPSINLYSCRPNRKPPSCGLSRRPSKCKKRCCPFPAYSECSPLPCPPLRRQVECPQIASQCEINQYSERKSKYHLPPPLPVWPIRNTRRCHF